MARVALLCWEIGGGLGHAVSLARIASALKRRGWSCVLALPPKRIPHGVFPPGTDLRAGPRWGDGASTKLARTNSSASMGDMLADIGLRSADWTRAQIIGWHLRFAEVMPSLVLADHAPGAVLASRGRIPCVAVGTGYSVPPPGLQPLPPLHDRSAVIDDEDATLATVNTVLSRFGSRPLATLADALTANLACPCTLPLLDPYDSARSKPVLGPLLGQRIEGYDERGDVLCYFQPGGDRTRLNKLIACLKGLAAPLTIVVPGLRNSEAAAFAKAGLKATSGIGKGTETLRPRRLLVHAGGHGMASAGLLAGVPQLALHYDIEKELNGKSMARAGLASHLPFDYVPPARIRAAILQALGDSSLTQTAATYAREYSGYAALDVAARVAELGTGIAA